MRRFMPVQNATVCATCGGPVEATPEGVEYSRQATVTFDDSQITGTYCSNRCINADAERLENLLHAEDAAKEAERARHAKSSRGQCVKPGEWIIDGYTVNRVRYGGWTKPTVTAWVIWRGRAFVDSVDTLANARAFIVAARPNRTKGV